MSHLVSEFSSDERLLTLHNLHPLTAEVITNNLAALLPYFRRTRSYMRKLLSNARRGGETNPDLQFDQLAEEPGLPGIINITIKGTLDEPEVYVAQVQPNFRLAGTRYSSRQILPESILDGLIGKQVCEVIEGTDQSTIIKAFTSGGLTYIRCDAKPASIVINLGP